MPRIVYVYRIYSLVGVVQLARTPVCGTGGPGFEFQRPPHIYSLSLVNRAPVYETGGQRFESFSEYHPEIWLVID